MSTVPNNVIQRRYRAPSRSVDASVSLDEFTEEEVRAYLAHLTGEAAVVVGGRDADEGMWISPADLDRIDMLNLCGQKDHAREWLLEIVSREIGRPL